jgi:alpha-L-fucosidase 2
MLSEQLRTSTLSNLWDTHPPFQIDGNFGACAGIAEMLVQSHGDEVHVLPALPGAWPRGEVRGLRARGDLTVDVRWSAGAAEEIVVAAGHDHRVVLRSDLFAGPFEVTGADGRPVPHDRDGARVAFTAVRDGRYVARRLPA